MAIETKSAKVTKKQTGRVDLVVQSLTELSRRRLRGLFDHGCVQVNGQPCPETATRVRAGDEVTVSYDPHQGYPEKKRPWSDRTFSVVFEDKHLIVVNKSASVLTVATDSGDPTTLVARVSTYLHHASRRRAIFVAHRLDRGVSGLLVFGKTPEAGNHLQEQFKLQKPQRVFVGVVAGQMKSDRGTLRSYLDTGNNLDVFATHRKDQGQQAVTHYEVEETLSDLTVVQIRLETARRHQMRVQFADAGHPFLGDPRYGGRATRHEQWNKKRIALHACALQVEHPVTGEQVAFECPTPKAMLRFTGS
ncbi:MAG: RluA family pseudouridine synthase [Pirellulaceae bacterium]|nr:RluA family pseudouridine synthase [Pirellulaceae bacterium]HJN09841.1 RluA family pseudouridine synthase [Pirellulaceae bacterium]